MLVGARCMSLACGDFATLPLLLSNLMPLLFILWTTRGKNNKAFLPALGTLHHFHAFLLPYLIFLTVATVRAEQALNLSPTNV